jgi:hypothetical protein
MVELGRFTIAQLSGYAAYNAPRIRRSEYPRPDNMIEAKYTRDLQNDGRKIIAVVTAAGVGVLSLFTGGGVIFAPQAATAAYIITDKLVGTFMKATTISENTPSLSKIGDRLAEIGRVGREMHGAGWSLPPLILSRFTNDRLVKGALAGAGAINFAAALHDTATAIKLMKGGTPPARVDDAMKYIRVRYKFYRALAWGAIFDLGICLLLNAFIPPLGLSHLKITYYGLSALIVGGLACTTTLSYCGLRYLDKMTLCFFAKCMQGSGTKKLKNADVLMEKDDFLIVHTSLLKGLGTHALDQKRQEAEFVRPKD